MTITGQQIRFYQSILPYTFAVGSYSRNAHLKSYRDADFVTLLPFEQVIKLIKVQALGDDKSIKIVKRGKAYMQIQAPATNGDILDFFHTTKKSFYKDYLTHHLKATQLISINKKLKQL